jgi:hypothetical protein
LGRKPQVYGMGGNTMVPDSTDDRWPARRCRARYGLW